MEGSLLDPEQVRAALRGCDAVIHLAAWADVDQVIKDPATAEAVNVRGTQVILDAARAEGIKRVVYGSTVWAYDKAVGAEPFDEDTPLGLPSHFYTATKLAGEMYCRSYGELYGQEHTILRFGIPYGPRSRPTAVVAAFVAKALRGRAADDRGRRVAVAALRVRRGSGGRRRGGPRTGGGEPDLQPRLS